jgi:hypothetical protein
MDRAPRNGARREAGGVPLRRQGHPGVRAGQRGACGRARRAVAGRAGQEVGANRHCMLGQGNPVPCSIVYDAAPCWPRSDLGLAFIPRAASCPRSQQARRRRRAGIVHGMKRLSPAVCRPPVPLAERCSCLCRPLGGRETAMSDSRRARLAAASEHPPPAASYAHPRPHVTACAATLACATRRRRVQSVRGKGRDMSSQYGGGTRRVQSVREGGGGR